MKVYELLEKEEIRGLRKEIDLFTEKMLDSYIQKIGSLSKPLENKEIFDPIWGPVEFNVGEIILLDSPLIQRLRKIKQLGLASYVYCDADYSRFAHTIGVFWVASEMAGIINKHLPQKNKANDYNFIQIVRLAAIFHDTGHMYFSHVTEHYFTENIKNARFIEIKKAIEVFSNVIDNNVSLHEMISVMIVNSPSVKRLLCKIGDDLDGLHANSEEKITNIIEYISCLILGQPNDSYLLPYYQIINGPVDADKCDYLSRDSHATNVPVAVDIFRLIHKLNVENGSLPDNIPDTLLWEDNKNKEMYYPTIKSSAVEALNQLLMARSIMYNSVYYHQKVRTAETMLRGVLEGLNDLKVPAVIDFTQVMLMTDDAFGYYCYNILQDTSGINKIKLKEETNKLNKINCRFLMKRACSVDLENIVTFNEKKEYIFDRDIFMLSESKQIKKIEEETRNQYNIICKLLNMDEETNRTFSIMEFPKVTLSDSIPNIIISYGNGNVKYYSEIFQTGTWIESKESRNKEQYLLTDCAYRELAFLAFQKTLFLEYGICLRSNAAVCSKISPEIIKDKKRRLLTQNFYTDAMILVSDIILPDFDKDIKNICNKYQTYEGSKGKILLEKDVKDFLNQFLQIKISENECRILLDGVLRILENALFIDRKYFAESIEKVFEELDDGSHKLHVCPLGKETDSGIHMTYYLNDLSKNNIEIVSHLSLQDALKGSLDDDHIVLFDDGAYSGKQVSAIFEEYMGIPIEKRIIKEEHVNPLTEEEKKQLEKRKVSIAYICFNAQNKEKIIDAAKKIGISIYDIKYMYNMQEKIFESDIIPFKNNFQKELVKKHLNDIGFQILTSVKNENGKYKEGWSLERIKNCSLGYNDAQQCVILKSSVPTYTLTAFWSENGFFEENEWRPLFVRTNK